MLLRPQILAGDQCALLKCAKIYGIDGYLGCQRHEDAPAFFHSSQKVGIGGLYTASNAAENIQFPGSIETGLELA
jgi:hypothetical protein